MAAMAQFLVVAFLATVAVPGLGAGLAAGLGESEVEHKTISINEHDFAGSAGSSEEEFEDQQDRMRAKLSDIFKKGALEWEEKELPHVDYSESLLSTAHELLKKHAPKFAHDQVSVKDALESSGVLRDSVAARMNANGPSLMEAELLLLDRAKNALGFEQGARLEQAVKHKDSTPCFHIAENIHGMPLADFDPPSGMDFEGFGMAAMAGGSYPNHEVCTNNCLKACKIAMFQGGHRFAIDANEMRTMQMSEREIALTGGQQQVGAKCDGNRCSCLDATATSQKVHQLRMQGFNVDLTKDEPLEAYPSEMQCMDYCHDEHGGLEVNGMHIPVVFQGVCFDEAFQNDSDFMSAL